MNNMQGIIFDKDGTLLDFEAFWLPVTEGALDTLAKWFGLPEDAALRAARRLGVAEGRARKDGILCAGTYSMIAAEVLSVFSEYGKQIAKEEMEGATPRAFEENMCRGNVVPAVPDLAELLRALRSEGNRLFVATTDTPFGTAACLKALGLDGLFDAVYTDGSGCPVKPDPYIVGDIVQKYGICRSRLAMVGDTRTDLDFAERGGIFGIAYLRGASDDAAFASRAGLIIRDLHELRGVWDIIRKEEGHG